jgi:hypothetical protein
LGIGLTRYRGKYAVFAPGFWGGRTARTPTLKSLKKYDGSIGDIALTSHKSGAKEAFPELKPKGIRVRR